MKTEILLSYNLRTDNYVAALESCGAKVHIAERGAEVPMCDGLLLMGGADIHPARYGEQPDYDVLTLMEERDEFEFSLLKWYLDEGKPVLGICRGHQLLNVYFGGSLYQDLEHGEVHRVPDEVGATHGIFAKQGSLIHSFYGDSFSVNSFHHQGVKRPGNGIKVTATCSVTGVAEAIEHETLPIFGVQWHPERMCYAKKRDDVVDGSAIFKYFIDLCAKLKHNVN